MIKVLIVDDEEAVRQGLKMRLELEKDITIIGTADNGLEAIQKTQHLHPDVIIMDLQMDKMGGIEATKIICENQPSVSVMILSIHNNLDLKKQAYASGAIAFLEKTGTSNEINELICKLLLINKLKLG